MIKLGKHLGQLIEVKEEVLDFTKENVYPQLQQAHITSDFELCFLDLPDYIWSFFNTPFYLANLGGSGDCLIRVVNYLLYELYGLPVYDAKSWYKSFGLTEGTYLNEDHVSALAKFYGVCICVLTQSGGELQAQLFGTNVELPWIYLYNEYPFHYYAICFDSALEDEIYESLEDEVPFSDHQPMLDPVLPGAPQFNTLCSYLSRSSDFLFTDSVILLNCYRVLHMEVTSLIDELNITNHTPSPIFFKLYYKFRHNVFAYLCNNSLSKTREFDTDIPLSKWISSPKTPDFILENSDGITLIEYTVSNRYDVADYNKGGGCFEVKYDKEAKQIQDVTGLLCRVQMIPAILNENNIEEVRSILLCLNGRDITELLQDFFSIANEDRDIINTAQVSAGTVYDLPELNTNLPNFERPSMTKTLMLTPDFLSSVLKAIETFSKTAFSILNRGRGKYIRLCHDISTGGTYLQYNKKFRPRITSSEFLDSINKEGLDYVLSIMYLYREGAKVSWSDIQGTVPCTVKKTNVKTYKMKNVFRLSDNFYNSVDIQNIEHKELEVNGFQSLGSKNRVFFHDTYFKDLCTHDFDNIAYSDSKSLLANCTAGSSDIDECMEIFNEENDVLNSVVNFAFHPKPTFMIPILSDFSCAGDTPSILNIALSHTTGYTHELISRAEKNRYLSKPDNVFKDERVRKLRSKLNEANVAIYDKVKLHDASYKRGKLTPAQSLLVKQQRETARRAQREYSDYLSTIKGSKNEHMLKLSRGKNGIWKHKFREEMLHFQQDKSVYRGFGKMSQSVYTDTDAYFKGFISSLSEDIKLDKKALFETTRTPGPELLNNLKNQYTGRAIKLAEECFLGKRVDGICTLYQRVALHLFNESTKPYNSSYCKVDTLGFDNFLIIVRGGSKIYKHQKSKLFKIICLTSEIDSYYGGYDQNPNYKVVKHSAGNLVITPWTQLHQDILFDYLSIRERTFMNMFSTQTRLDPDTFTNVRPLTMLPFILSLHNRRKTESFMHNSRYLIVNPLAERANIQGIISSFAGFNYTYLDAWLRERISTSYSEFAKSLFKAKSAKGSKIDALLGTGVFRDLWLGNPIENADQLTNFIYITYMMTKAPVNSSLEQASNLWEILKDVSDFESVHPDVVGLKDESLRFNLFTDDDDVYQDDFKYDPVFCNYLGHHLGGYLKNLLKPSEISNSWEVFKNQDLSSIANSNGLRGFNENNFYNKKGYEVVFDQIDELIGDESLLELTQSYIIADESTSYSMIKNDKLKLSELKTARKNLLFHIVHKIQRGGSREIFCMDISTKAKQNPIEKLMKMICKRIPNEYISIPSNKRHGLIHTDFYEKKINSDFNFVYRWVLDCRRWAPHSVFQKYVYFIEGLSFILPPDFVKYFREFATEMFNKRFITRKHVYDKIKNNKRFEQYKNLLKASNEIADTYYLTVQFSFVMGIFNHLSTILHAANQIVASEVIRNQCLRRSLGLVVLDAKCHSDDSVVSSYHEKQESLIPSLKLYDWLLKGANHMLSVKKSQVNANLYLEFLSVLYLFDRFLPVLPKFSSTIPFRPSDKGYAADISFAITQSIEMLTQGGSYEESFIIMKLAEKYIRNCYRLNFVPNLPPQMLGSLDSHPIELLYSGGLSDLYRCMKYNSETFWDSYGLLSDMGLVNPEEADVSLKWDMSARITGGPKKLLEKYKGVLESVPEDIKWTLNNSKLGNGYLNMLWYTSKLMDRSFYSSLVNEPVSRRFSRLFGSGAYRTVLSSDGARHSVPKLGLALSAYTSESRNRTPVSSLVSFFSFCCKDLDFFYQAIEGATTQELLPSLSKEKPVVFSQGLSVMGNLSISATDYVSYTREPKGYKLLGRRANPYRECDKITKQLDLLGIDTKQLSNDQLYSVTRKLFNDETRNFRLIMAVPGDQRRIDSYADAVNSLSYNSFKWKKLSIRARNTSSVDWSRKMVGGKLPSSVTDYLEYYWFSDLCKKSKVADLDIFSEGMPKEQTLLNEIPDEWKPVINAHLDPSKMLSQMPYWIHWSKEQIRIGHRWYGSGVCYISTPELFLKLLVLNGKISKIYVDHSITGPLSTATTWYLTVFFFYSGLISDVVPHEFGDPAKLYLGHDKEGRFRFGRPNSSQMIYIDTEAASGILPSFCYRDLKYIKTGSKVYYLEGDKKHKVNFFIPLDQPVSLNISRFLDPKKIRNLISTSDVLNDFIRNYATAAAGSTKKDFEVLKRNFDASLLFNIVYSCDIKHKITLDYGNNPLISSIIQWKQNHPGFGFPSLEEMEQLSSTGSVAPLTPKMLDVVKKLSKSKIVSSEFDSILSKLLMLSHEDREQYLASLFPNLSGLQQSNTLVLLRKSTHIYHSCKLVTKERYDLFSRFTFLVSQALKDSGIISGTLDELRKSVNSDLGKQLTQEEIWEILSAIYLQSADASKNIHCNQFNSAKLLTQALNEMLSEGLGTWLNISSMSDPMFMSVEFKVESLIILEWYEDILDCVSLLKGYDESKQWSYHTLFGEGNMTNKAGVLYGKVTNFQKYYVRRNYNTWPHTIQLIKKYRQKQLQTRTNKKAMITYDLTQDLVAGRVDIAFEPLTEEWQEEMDFGWEYETEFDDYETDPDTECQDVAYIRMQTLSMHNLARVRGTAWSLYISSSVINWDIKNVKDNLVVFEPLTKIYKRAWEKLSEPEYIVYIGKKKSPCVPVGYKRLAWEKTTQLLCPKFGYNTLLKINGKDYEKIEVVNTVGLASQIDTLDTYFNKLSPETQQEVAEEQQEILKFAEEHLLLDPNHEVDINELNTIMSQYKPKEQGIKEKKEGGKEEKEEKEEEKEEGKEGKKKKKMDNNVAGSSLEDILKKQGNLLEQIAGFESIKNVDFQSFSKEIVEYHFKEPIDLLTDMEFKSEIESLLPGVWHSLNRMEISMSKAIKRDRLTLARAKISQMHGNDRKMHSAIYLFVKFLLGELPEKGGVPHMSNSFALMLDSLFNNIGDEENDQEVDYVEARPRMLIPEDISFLE